MSWRARYEPLWSFIAPCWIKLKASRFPICENFNVRIAR